VGREDKKADKNSSTAPDRFVNPRDLNPTQRSSLKSMLTLTLRMLKSIASMPSKINENLHTADVNMQQKINSLICICIRKTVNFGNYIYAYKGKRGGGKVDRVGEVLSFLSGKGIIALSRFFMEGYREGWEGG
jgi:hypothetical protein